MNEFTENHSDHLLSKEWLVKIDNEKSVPYLIKLHSAFADQTCVFLITDTKTVWVEVLSRQQLSRRWSTLNTTNSALNHLLHLEEDSWLYQALQYLVDVHSPGMMGDISFDVIDSRYSDLAIDLCGDSFKWRWETFSIGPKQSADVLSKHLMVPLLSTAYLAFMSPDAISEISGSDLEKVVDRVGRAARRSVDTHIRNIFSQPRACTSIRRMSALFAFSTNLPAIIDEFESPELTLPSVDSAARSQWMLDKTPANQPTSINLECAQSSNPHVKIGAGDGPLAKATAVRQGPGTNILGQARAGDPHTEAGEDEDDSILKLSGRQLGKGKGTLPFTAIAVQSKPASRASSTSSAPGSHVLASVSQSGVPSKTPSSDSDSPPRPNKRARAMGQDRNRDDSDDGAKRGELRWRGTKQPIKRGGKRF
ncbi:hypothetical protein BJV74DRAFT_878371 [Russula compacta]|nr:hypothetical protein BJV74DRAFT_878371 [Russula compacta]